MGRKLKVFPYPMKTRLYGLVVVMVCLTGCRSLISSVDHVLHSPADELRQDDLPTHSSKEVWQYVNGKPQFHITDHYFALYIGLWRGFSAEEMDLISKGAALLGHRNIQWTVRSCDSKQMLNEDSEDLWTYENLELSPNGQVIPIKEAIRPDFRYFSLANFNGLHIKK